MGRDRVKEEKDFNEITTVNSGAEINKIKNIILKIITNDIKLVAKNESQKKLIQSIKNNEVTICSGRAGTGKTFVALAYALSLLRKSNNRYKRIYLVKSVTTLKNEELGFLKGDMKDKFEPFMWSYYINMEKLIFESAITTLREQEIIRPFPLAYIKGSSMDDCIIIADEMQNVILDNALTLLTRIGTNCKLIVLGDVDQIDLKNKKDSSLEALLKMYADVDQIGTIEMNENDTNVRNPLIDIIVEKYKEYMATIDVSGNTKTVKTISLADLKEARKKTLNDWANPNHLSPIELNELEKNGNGE